MNNAHLELTGVGISFPTDKGLYCALQNVNLRIAKGEFVTGLDQPCHNVCLGHV